MESCNGNAFLVGRVGLYTRSYLTRVRRDAILWTRHVTAMAEIDDCFFCFSVVIFIDSFKSVLDFDQIPRWSHFHFEHYYNNNCFLFVFLFFFFLLFFSPSSDLAHGSLRVEQKLVVFGSTRPVTTVVCGRGSVTLPSLAKQ